MSLNDIKQLSLHEARTGKCLGKFVSTEGSVTSVEFWDDHLLVRAGLVRCFNTKDLSEIPAGIPLLDYPSFSWDRILFSSDGTMLAVPGMEGVLIYDRQNAESIQLPISLSDFSFRSDSNSLVSFSAVYNGPRLIQFFPVPDSRHERLEKELKDLLQIPFTATSNIQIRRRIEALPRSGWYQRHLLARAKSLNLLHAAALG